MALCANQLALLYPGCYLSFSYQVNANMLTNGLTEAILHQYGLQLERPGIYLGSGQAVILSIAQRDSFLYRGQVVYHCSLMFIQPYVDIDHIYSPGECLTEVFSLDPAGRVRLGTEAYGFSKLKPKGVKRPSFLTEVGLELAVPDSIRVIPGPRIYYLTGPPEFQPGDLIFYSTSPTWDELFTLSRVEKKMSEAPAWYLISSQSITGQPLGQTYFSTITGRFGDRFRDPVTSPNGLNPQRATSSNVYYIPVTPSADKALQQLTKAHQLPSDQIEALFNQQQAIEQSRQWPGC